MLKRGAQGPQGSKEDEGIFGMASTPDDKPHRATAAQLANRKIKDVRKRRAPTPTTGGGASDTASFNPFASVAPASAPAPTPSTGFTFGQTQSQSFPGASSGPSQGGMFSSGTNGQAGGQASFSFGAGPTSFGSAPASNSFSINTSFGGNSQSSTNGFSFGGFNAGNQSTPSFGGFGAQQNTSTPVKPALFGQSTSHMTSPADDSMQTSPDTKPKGASLFAPKPAAGPSALGTSFSNISGQSSASNPFAPKTTALEKPADKPAETQPFKPLFGSTPAASKPLDADKQQPTASNPFANLSGPAPASSTNLFAPKTTAAEQTPTKPAEQAKPFGTLFGSTSSSQPSGSTSNIFAPKPAAEEPKAGNPFATLSAPSSFGTFSSPKVTGTEGSGKPAETRPFMFGTPAAPKVSETVKEQTAPPAFGNMFSPKPAVENATAKPAGTQPFMFGTPAASKVAETGKEQTASPAFGNMFSPKPVAENAAAKPAADQPFKPMFGTSVAAKPVEAEKEESAVSSVFAPKVTSQEQTPVPAGTSTFGSMFGASPTPSKVGEEKSAQATPINPFASLSGNNAFNNSFSPKPTEQAAKAQTPSTSLFGASTAADNKLNKDNSVAALSSPLTNPFTAEPKVSNEPQTEGATNAVTKVATKVATNAPAQKVSFAQSPSPRDSKSPSCLPSSSSSSLPSSSSTSTVSTTFTASYSDSLFPRPDYSLSIDHSLPKDFDDMPLKRLFPEDPTGELRERSILLMKIGALTESFQREIAKCDPMTDDIDEVLILYAELRRELGVPIGSINPEEEAKRAAIDERDAAKEAPDGCVPPHIPTPPTFVPPSLEENRQAHAKKASGGSSTSSKFAQSFSAPSTLPAATSADASAPVAAQVSTAPVAPAPAPVTTSIAGPSSAAAPTSLTASIAGPSSAAAPVAPAPASVTASVAGPSLAAAPVEIPKFDGAGTSTGPSAFKIPKFDGAGTSTGPSAFKIPKFGGPATGVNFDEQMKAESDKTLADLKAKRKAEEFDSDEETEEEWERRDEERQREKLAQIAEAAKKRAVFVPGEGFKFVDSDDTASQSVKEPATSAAPVTAAGRASPETPATLRCPFSTLPPPPGSNDSVSSSQDHPPFLKSSTDSSGFSTIAGSEMRSPADAALFGGKPGSPPPFFGAYGAGPSSSSSESSVFRSNRKPVPLSQNIFGKLKPTSPKRKASADESDDENDSPPKKAKSTENIFGGPTPASNIFGPKPTSPKRKAFADESDKEDNSPAKKTKPSPPPPSAGASLFERVSTAAQPAMASAESTPVGTDDEDNESGEIFDLAKGNGGEEEEIVVFEDKSRVFKLEDRKWLVKGTGPVRLLKHPVTGRARIVCRAEPSGNVTMNSLLKKEFEYIPTSNSVQFLLPNESGQLSHWAVRVKPERLQEFLKLVHEIKN
ncbi:uncharacterized protein PGRI_002800 [Penicillium griseofulvum]|uniref:RanBD1 domain-containing protein n=1 Tax=Penicillium patulum TaxID=5078 RepID=A0A135LW85_PENPA|nr:uncharacterized protein PGRI_002800 [Penicillium griseofulvum]KXG53230.1 hypothetical protein PGRI_002800 [Penicillium griseofulvum]